MSQHSHNTRPLSNMLLDVLAKVMGQRYCPACAAGALINALSFVMSQTIRHTSPKADAKTMCDQVAGHLETMAASYRKFEPTEPEQPAPVARKH